MVADVVEAHAEVATFKVFEHFEVEYDIHACVGVGMGMSQTYTPVSCLTPMCIHEYPPGSLPLIPCQGVNLQ